MFCTKCGANLPDGTKFCTICGTSLEAAAPVEPVAEPVAEVEAPATPATETKTQESSKIDVNAVKDQLVDTLKPVTNGFKSFFSKKAVRIGVIAGIVLLLAVGILGAILSANSGFVTVKQDVLLEAEDGTLNIIVNGKVLKDTIELPSKKDINGDPIKNDDGDKEYYSYYPSSSMDGKVTGILVYGYKYEKSKDGSVEHVYESELYVLKGKKLKMVAEDVVDFTVSVNGKGVAYTTENEKGEDDRFTTYTLSLYNTGNKKSTTVSDEVFIENSADVSFEMSPDGKSVVYYVGEYDEDSKKAEYSVMLFSGKKSTEIASFDSDDKKNIKVVGLSNKGKYIYAIETEYSDSGKVESTMYCFNNKGKSTKLEECDAAFNGAMNKDHTQILFFNEGETYVAKKNKPAERLFKKEVFLVAPDNVGYSKNTAPISNFYGQVYGTYSDGECDIYLIKKPGKDNKLVDGCRDNVTMDDSGKYIYYVTDKQDLKCVKVSMSKNAKSKAVDIAEDVTSYVVTSNRKLVYFRDGDELYSVNGKKGGDPKEVCDEDVRAMVLTKDDVLFYLVADEDDKEGELFATKNGKEGKSVLDDVTDFEIAANDILYAYCDEDIYVSSGKKMKKLNLN